MPGLELDFVSWVNLHADALKYLAIVVGFLYSSYRRYVNDKQKDLFDQKQTAAASLLVEYVESTRRRDEIAQEAIREILAQKPSLVVRENDLQTTLAKLELSLQQIDRITEQIALEKALSEEKAAQKTEGSENHDS